MEKMKASKIRKINKNKIIKKHDDYKLGRLSKTNINGEVCEIPQKLREKCTRQGKWKKSKICKKKRKKLTNQCDSKQRAFTSRAIEFGEIVGGGIAKEGTLPYQVAIVTNFGVSFKN